MKVIKTRFGEPLYVSESAITMRDALIEAVNARADLTGANLTGVDLTGVDLTGVDLTGVDLTGVDLTGVDLTGANLTWANLTWANLTWANLTGANLTWANLTWANLTMANLTMANLTMADLTGANLTGANLTRANLTMADLTGANLTGANLTRADLTRAVHGGVSMARTIICAAGDIIGWKQCREGRIVQLAIPAGAARSNASGRRCRAEYATVTAIYTAGGDAIDIATSMHDSDFRYVVGETVTPTEPFDTDRWNECGSGIHFYITREEAVAHL